MKKGFDESELVILHLYKYINFLIDHKMLFEKVIQNKKYY